MKGQILAGVWVPGLPHVLRPERNAGWATLYRGISGLESKISALKPDVIVLYSTQWVSVLGTSFQIQPNPKGVHVDENWYDLGDLPFDFKTDVGIGARFAASIGERMPTKAVNYEEFPIDTGSIVAMRLLNAEAKLPVSIVSSWVYADAAKSGELGRIMRETILSSGKRVVVAASSLLSARYFTHEIDPVADRVSSLEDDAWNRKFLGLLESGNFDAAASQAVQYAKSSPLDMQLNAFHWLRGGDGRRSSSGTCDRLRANLGNGGCRGGILYGTRSRKMKLETINSPRAPFPLGNYSHAVAYGDLVFISGIAARDPKTNQVPGLKLDADGKKIGYDIRAETRSTLENIRTILEDAGSDLEHVIEVNTYLLEMKDFGAYNEVYAEFFARHKPARTTIGVASLPGHIAIEMKMVAVRKRNG